MPCGDQALVTIEIRTEGMCSECATQMADSAQSLMDQFIAIWMQRAGWRGATAKVDLVAVPPAGTLH